MKQWQRNYICKMFEKARKELKEDYYYQVFEVTEEDTKEFQELDDFLYELEDYAMEKTK